MPPITRPQRGPDAERDVLADIRLALGVCEDVWLMRNGVGVFDVLDEQSGRLRKVRGGLVRGSSDLVGILAPGGRWLALEVKRPGCVPSAERIARLRARIAAGGTLRTAEMHDVEQDDFLRLVRRMGGFGAIVDSVRSAEAAIERARRGGVE